MGACWQEKNFQFGLVATDVVCIHYVFYADLLPQAGTEAALLNLVELDKQFQFGDVWGWQAEYSGKNEAPLTYLIQLEKSDGTKHFHGRRIIFFMEYVDYRLCVRKLQLLKLLQDLLHLNILWNRVLFTNVTSAE